MYTGLDLSLPKTGIASVDKDGKLRFCKLISTNSKYAESKRMVETIKEIANYSLGNVCVVEDTFYGKNFRGFKTLSRLVGAVQVWYYTVYNKEIKLMMAVSARKLVGLNGACHKSEVQLYVMDKYNIGKKKQRENIREVIKKYNDRLIFVKKKLRELNQTLKHTKGKINKSPLEVRIKKLQKSKSNIKYQLGKLSKKIEEVFELSEHQADATILALAGREKYGQGT